MDDLLLEERIRYPPFESYRFRPELLPIGVSRTEIASQISKEEANNMVADMPPPFRIGDKKSWLVERRYIYQGKTLKLNKIKNRKLIVLDDDRKCLNMDISFLRQNYLDQVLRVSI